MSKLPIPGPSANWRKLVQDLRDARLKWRQIGDYCEVSRSTVHDLWTGRTVEPSKRVGTKLKRLHTFTMRRLRHVA
jgi:hypothetical protein